MSAFDVPRPTSACRCAGEPGLTVVVDEHARTLILRAADYGLRFDADPSDDDSDARPTVWTIDGPFLVVCPNTGAFHALAYACDGAGSRHALSALLSVLELAAARDPRPRRLNPSAILEGEKP